MPQQHRKHRTSASGPSNARLSRQVQVQIGQRLRAFYEALALGEQPVPDRFIEIIDRLDQSRPESRQEKRS
jgi:Anti-sigma factor NepR